MITVSTQKNFFHGFKLPITSYKSNLFFSQMKRFTILRDKLQGVLPLQQRSPASRVHFFASEATKTTASAYEGDNEGKRGGSDSESSGEYSNSSSNSSDGSDPGTSKRGKARRTASKGGVVTGVVAGVVDGNSVQQTTGGNCQQKLLPTPIPTRQIRFPMTNSGVFLFYVRWTFG